MNITERFLNYTQFDTQSSEESESVPSTSKQLIFAEYLKKELEREGLEDVELDEKGYIYATLKSNIKGDVPTIGFISHYDTSPDCSGVNIKPRIVNNYDGKDIILSEGMNCWHMWEKTSSSPMVRRCWVPTTRQATQRSYRLWST